MSRWVTPQRSGLRSGGNDVADDTVLKRMAKYVPAEILTGYTALFALLSSVEVSEYGRKWAAILLMVLFVAVTFEYIRRNAPSGVVQKAHTLVSPVAFVALAYPISSSALLDWYFPIVAFFAQVIVVALSYFVRPVES